MSSRPSRSSRASRSRAAGHARASGTAATIGPSIGRGASGLVHNAVVATPTDNRTDDENENVRPSALFLVRRYGASAAPAVGSLTRALKTGDARTQLLAIQVLDAIGTQAKAAVPGLTAALVSPEQLAAARAKCPSRAR